MTKLFIGSDHAGFLLKNELKVWLVGKSYILDDVGCDSLDSVDYPDIAGKIASRLVPPQQAILICGSGVGMSIAANRHHHIRAAQCLDPVSARLSRLHNDANVLTLGARLIGIDMAKAIIDAFLTTAFEGGRHSRRIDKLGKDAHHASNGA